MTRSSLDTHVAEELEESPHPARLNAPQGRAQQSIYTAADLEQALAIAQQGQRLEPDNSFFDWIIAECLFGLERDNEALEVLHQAAQKPHFDAHVKDDVQAAIAAHQRVRPLLEEEKLFILAAELLPHYAQHRHTARLALSAAIQKERAGNHQRALEIYYDIARLGAVMGKEDYTVIGSLVGIALESAAWAGKARQLTPAQTPDGAETANGKDNRQANTKLLATRFAQYATLHGRSDIAAETMREAEAANRVQQIVKEINFNEGFFGVPLHSFKIIFNLFWGSKLLLTQLLLNLALWLGLSLVVRYGLSPRREAVTWLDVTSPLIVSSCVTAALLTLALFLGGGWRQLGLENSDAQNSQDLIALICNAAIVTPALVGALLCGCGVIWRQRLNGWRASFHYGVHWYQQMLGALVVVGSVVYFTLSVAALPLRHGINAKLDVGVQVGELALLQAQQKKS
ncbi:MAG: hypothetical protein JOZ57_12720 [Abitibacteriaceae bacterium]|nr:hypothetical protein [Abditibacteriaceae bacterium]